MVPQPVKALLLIYPITPDLEKRRKEDDEKLKQEGVSPSTDTSVLWIKQKVRRWTCIKSWGHVYRRFELQISNACGTIGLLHALLNVRPATITQANPD